MGFASNLTRSITFQKRWPVLQIFMCSLAGIPILGDKLQYSIIHLLEVGPFKPYLKGIYTYIIARTDL